MMIAQLDFSPWLPKPGETPAEYWLSFSPMAPVFGVNWRFADFWMSDEEFSDTPQATAAPSPIRGDAEDAEIMPATTIAESAAAAEAVVDDLTAIKGVGPKMAQRLNEVGVRNFGQIAKWNEAMIAEMEEKLGSLPGAITRGDWVGQARDLSS